MATRETKADAPAPRRPGRPRMDTPSQEYLERLASIVDAAAELFGQHGYDAASLEQIADELDLRKATLYHYVGSKADLLRLVFERTLALALERFESIQEIPEPRDRLEALIRHQVVTVATYPDYFSVFFDQRGNLAPPDEEIMRGQQRRYVEAYAAAVRDAADAGCIAAVDPVLGAQGILGMTSWIYKWFRADRHSADEVADTCVRLVLGGDRR